MHLAVFVLLWGQIVASGTAISYEYMEVVRHVVVNDMSCWTIVEHVYGIITLVINSSFSQIIQLYNVSPITGFIRYKNNLHYKKH